MDGANINDPYRSRGGWTISNLVFRPAMQHLRRSVVQAVHHPEENDMPERINLDDLRSEDGPQNEQAREDTEPGDQLDMENGDAANSNASIRTDRARDRIIFVRQTQNSEDDSNIGRVNIGEIYVRILIFQNKFEDTIWKNLETRDYAKEDNGGDSSNEAEICVVCQLEYEDKETIGVLQCKHEYHEECIKKWLLIKNFCPLCKQTVM